MPRYFAAVSLSDAFERTGIILYTRAYEAGIDFDERKLGSRVLSRTPALTCFDFGGACLVVELDDRPEAASRRAGRQRSCLRFNVRDVAAVAVKLETSGLAVAVGGHEWGTVARFGDPDGNLCALEDEGGFERQVWGAA